VITAWGWSGYCSSGGEQLHLCITCFVYIIIIIIIIIIVISSLTFLLNCLYLNPQVFTFSHSPSHPTGKKGGAEQKWLAGS